MMLKLHLLFIILFIQQAISQSTNLTKNRTRFLSRKKRYLIFPQGSSFQVVFCLTFSSVIQNYGNFFVFGNTAALAWELPSTPIFYNFNNQGKKEEDLGQKSTKAESSTELELLHDHYDYSPIDYSPLDRMDNFINHGNYYYVEKPVITEYKRPSATWRQDRFGFNKPADYPEYSQRGQSYSYKNNQPNYHSYVHPVYYTVHRRTRRHLYKKIESFLTALNFDGKACLLKAICETRKSATAQKMEKGNFLEEMFKIIFRVKPDPNFPDEDPYDYAATIDNCDETYSSCTGSISNLL